VSEITATLSQELMFHEVQCRKHCTDNSVHKAICCTSTITKLSILSHQGAVTNFA
jgi:hypothetical protein